MNTKDYISTGILEEYVLGALSDQERREVECLSSIYPEISEALHAIEDDMFIVAQDSAVKTPEFLKSKILDAIDAEDNEIDGALISAEPKIVSINTHKDSSKGWKIAAVIALLAACGAAVGLFMKGGITEEEMQLAQQEISSLKATQDSLNTNVIIAQQNNEQLKSQLNFIGSSEVTSIKLAAMPNRDPSAEVMVYWNAESGDAILKVNNLPAPPDDKQYQLWGLVDGNPVDMGVFELNDLDQLQSMKNLKGAQTFAITLEKKGGSPTPNLEELFVIGNVAG